MQVLETIQEYTPIRHGLSYLSAWITKGHTYGDAGESDVDSETRLNSDEATEGASPVVADGRPEVDETQYGTPVGSDFGLDLGISSDPTRNPGVQLRSPHGGHNQDGFSCGFTAEAPVSENTAGCSRSLPRLSSTPAHCTDIKADYRMPDILVNDQCLPGVALGSLNHDGQDSPYVQESITREDVTALQGPHVVSRRYPTLFKAWQKRRMKARRQKRSTSLEGRLVFRRYRLPDSVSELGTLRQDARSKSESDIDGAVSASRVSEISGDSDQSVQSLNVINDNTDDDYVDIDFYRRGSLSGSSCKDTSASSGSLDLSSDWTEFTLSVSELSVGEECKESDQQDTESCRSQDLSSNLNSQRTMHKRWRKRFLHGQAVNEFVDKECFCCHCVIL